MLHLRFCHFWWVPIALYLLCLLRTKRLLYKSASARIFSINTVVLTYLPYLLLSAICRRPIGCDIWSDCDSTDCILSAQDKKNDSIEYKNINMCNFEKCVKSIIFKFEVSYNPFKSPTTFKNFFSALVTQTSFYHARMLDPQRRKNFGKTIV